MSRILSYSLAMLLLISGSLQAQDARSVQDRKKDEQIEQLKRQLNDLKQAANANNRSNITRAKSVPELRTGHFWSNTQPARVTNLAATGSRFATGMWSRSKEELEVENKIAELVQSIRNAEGDTEKESFKADLKQQLETQYDTYLTKLEEPLKEMEARLDKLREEYQKRKDARDELVKLRLDNFWYQANGMSWPGGGGSPSRLMFPTSRTISGFAVPQPSVAPAPPAASPRMNSTRTGR